MTEIITETLRFVNQIRSDHGREPLAALPKGVPTNLNDCPVARGIGCGAQVDSDTLFLTEFWPESIEDSLIELPLEVQNFVAAFDEGAYPELIAA